MSSIKRLVALASGFVLSNAYQLSMKEELLEQIRMIDEQPEAISLVEDSWEIKAGQCLQSAEYQVFDLKQFERAFMHNYKDESASNAENIEKYTHRHFQFKICSKNWHLGENDMKFGKCLDPKTQEPAKANGFLSKYDDKFNSLSDSECQYTFGDPLFKPIKSVEGDDEHHEDFVKGFEIKFVTQDPCVMNQKKNIPYTYTYEAICSKNVDDTIFEYQEGDICSAKVKYVGPAACSHIDSYKYYNSLQPLTRFVGFFQILFGIALLMVGARFFEYSFGALTGFIVFTLIMFGSYSANLFHNDKDLSINTGLLILFVILASLVSVWAAYYSRKFAHRFASVFLCGWIAGSITIMVLTLLGTDGKFKLALCLIAIVIGGMVGRKFRSEVRVLGTAMVGAFMVTYGLGQYLGGFPSFSTEFTIEKDDQDVSINVESSGLVFIAYVVLMAGLTIFGSYYQTNRPINDEDFDESKNPLIQAD